MQEDSSPSLEQNYGLLEQAQEHTYLVLPEDFFFLLLNCAR